MILRGVGIAVLCAVLPLSQLACGTDDDSLLVRIGLVCDGAPCALPDAVDQLQVVIQDDTTDVILADEAVNLDAALSSPVRVLLRPSDSTPTGIRVTVRAFLAGAPVGETVVRFDRRPDRTNEVALDVEVSAP